MPEANMPEAGANYQVTSAPEKTCQIKKTALCFFGGGLRATSGAAAAVSVGVALKQIDTEDVTKSITVTTPGSDSIDESDSELKFQESDIGALIR